MAPFLTPIDKPRGAILRIVFFMSRRQMRKVPTPISVFAARMPTGFLSLYGKISKLDKKLALPRSTAVLVRERVASLNSCRFCMDIARWYVMKESPDDVARLDQVDRYPTSPLFTEAERAALDYATELTTDKAVDPETFSRLAAHYNERQICDVVWLVASEHLYNLTNHGLNIGSDEFCRFRAPAVAPEKATLT